MSASEKILWNLIRRKRLGFRFNRQVAVGSYFLDFYCAEARLCVEVDGEQHIERHAQDKARDDYLRQLGVETLRIRSLDLFSDANQESVKATKLILDTCEARTGRPGIWPG